MTISETEARALAARAFCIAGVDPEAAEAAADALVLAEMMGIATHGLSRVAVYRDRIAAGGIDPTARPVVTAPAPALRHVDGRNGLGPAIARAALDAAMEAARDTGLGAAFVRGGNHLGALVPYLWRATEAGFAALITTNTAPMIAPPGGREARIGNNPLGIGVPNPGGVPVLLDIALSVAARSKVRAAARGGRAIPETWATDILGRPTTDPTAAMDGLMQAIGGAKGANLALCLDLLSAGLSGATMLGAVTNSAREPGREQDLGQLVLVIDAARLMPPETLSARMNRASGDLTNSAPVDPARPVRLPGARAVQSLKTARERGLGLSPEILSGLRAMAEG
ncbi:Ldh family oxidoreductase [Roseibacterium beibuensis]|uniref:Ldh family oxidoreductase n=1 Tax=[Roseibacterium] beibuensis TaxID=1193142 RepID=A0ABP9L5K3_9RHOB|nr:Ldh family oxidoreductase [Roseibacterium beibuensis]MCS6623946.1 Ldh family oxidoreductase [Roseibacterium beibuensis]